MSGNSEKPQPVKKETMIDEAAYYRALEREVNRAMAEDMQIGFGGDSVGEMICSGILIAGIILMFVGVLFGVGLFGALIMALLGIL